MPLYFAYGSNMDQAAMLQRCPASKPVGIGRLMRHRFIIFEEGYASVVRDPQRAVWGMVWDLALADVPAEAVVRIDVPLLSEKAVALLAACRRSASPRRASPAASGQPHGRAARSARPAR